jgi:hypothetical protein
LVFGASVLAGFASRLILPHTFNAAFTLSRLWWPDLAVMAIGAVLLTVSFARSESKPYLPSVIVAYELFMPLSASGFGVGNGIGDLWPHGVLVFVVHLAWATIFGLLTLAVLRFRPLSSRGYVFALGTVALAIFAIVSLTAPGRPQPAEATPEASRPAATQAAAPLPDLANSPTSAPPSATSELPMPTETESPPEATTEEPGVTDDVDVTEETDETVTPVPLTLDFALPVTETRTSTPPVAPTPIYATIHAREGGGAFIRKEPGGSVLATLDNGSIVQVLPDTQEVNDALWIHVAVTRNDIRIEGWIVQIVLETATPIPNWEPSETPNS